MKVKFELAVLKIQGRLDCARAYLEALEESLPHAKNVFAERLREKAEASAWPADEYYAEAGMLEHSFDDEIPGLASNAFIAYLHGIVEHGLTSVANRLGETRELPLKVNEISGSAIERSKTYLTKLAGIRIGNDVSWSGLRDLAKIRNIVLHAGGEIARPDLKEDIRRLQAQYPGGILLQEPWLGAPDEIRISLSFCKQMLTEVEQFFDWLFLLAGLQGIAVDKQAHGTDDPF